MFRCTAEVGISAEMLDLARTMPCASPPPIEWSISLSERHPLQCLVGDGPHDHHAAFLRTGAQAHAGSDVFPCWQDEDDPWLADLAVCLKVRRPIDSGCLIYAHHPGPCSWEYVDPREVALLAAADQIVEDCHRHRTP